tara:strand:+ start:269 stop:583 length:315 start_codon:yes stop_codon:yes gene_type:complete
MEPYKEYKNTPPTGFDGFKEYFVAMRPEVAIAELNILPKNASSLSAYSMLVNESGDVVSSRSYIGYGEERSGRPETLQNRHLFLCKRNKRVDLARALRDGNYID